MILLLNNSVTIGINLSLAFISATISVKYYQHVFSLLNYNLPNFHKHHQLFANNQ